MPDKAIKVAVLEGDFGSLCALGFPLPLSLQLQQSCLRLNEALWTAKSSSGGFSVSGEAGLTSWVALFEANVVPDVKVAPEDTLGDSGMSLLVGSVTVDTIFQAFALLFLFFFG